MHKFLPLMHKFLFQNIQTMRNIIIFGFVLALASCAMPAEEVKGVGFFTSLPEETFITGSDEITDIWTNYLDAHNSGDIETIKSMSADSIYILGPDGKEIRTKEEQAVLLEGWFAAANPKWDAYWAMPYESVPGGAEWIIAGHRVTETIEGEEKVTLQMIDEEIKDGKVDRFFVYAATPPMREDDAEE